MDRQPGNKKGLIKKRTGLIILGLCLVFAVRGQPDTPVTGNQSTDSARAVSLYDQARILFEKDSLDPALDIAGEALHFSMRSKQEDTELAILSLIAEIHDSQQLAGEAIPYYMRAANILEARQDTQALADAYTNIAQNYNVEEVHDKEGEYYSSFRCA